MLLSTEIVKDRIKEIDAGAKLLSKEIAERQLSQKQLLNERSVLIELLRARGEQNGAVHETRADSLWTIGDAILHVLKEASPNVLHSDDILLAVRALGAGSNRTNAKTVEWNIWKINDETRSRVDPAGRPVILGHGPHLYSYTTRKMLEGS
ncbi:MAG TPA: hypothetical protein VGF86_06045 [Candidatus Tumulicola sp.]|jgi:hypothetical protein